MKQSIPMSAYKAATRPSPTKRHRSLWARLSGSIDFSEVWTFAGWVLGWCGITWTAAELTTHWIWPGSLGLLAILFAGVGPLRNVFWMGLRGLSLASKEKRK